MIARKASRYLILGDIKDKKKADAFRLVLSPGAGAALHNDDEWEIDVLQNGKSLDFSSGLGCVA